MSEFGSAGEKTLPPAKPANLANPKRFEWLTRPLFLGLSLPLLAGVVVVIASAAYYLFAPAGPPTVNQLAFGDSEMQAVTNDTRPPPAFSADSDVSNVKHEVAVMVNGVRGYAEANRTAIELLVQTVKGQTTQITTLRQTLGELQAQNSLLSGRVSQLESKPVIQAKRKQPVAVKASSPIAGMHVSSVQTGMGWVLWQEKTWAVQVGDPIGDAVVTGIDATNRTVDTNFGTIR